MVNTFLTDNSIYKIENFQVKIQKYLGNFFRIDYLQVVINPEKSEETYSNKLGLLRVGSPESGLNRELQLREILKDHKMVAPLLAIEILKHEQLDKNFNSQISLDPETNPENSESPNFNSNYLEEEFYPEKFLGNENSDTLLFLLSEFPSDENTLEQWLKQENSLDDALLLTSQVCQFFRLVYQHQWCFISILSQFIQMGTPILIFDLTLAYPTGETLNYSFVDDYSPPELAYSHPIEEAMSSYLIGVLLYQSISPKTSIFKEDKDSLNLKIPPIPKLHQLLTIALSPLPDERFSLTQFLNLLIETRRLVKTIKTNWQIATYSTIGLSKNRLQNEDNYVIRQKLSRTEDTFILAAIADGMGGMAEGEKASQLAINRLLNTPLPELTDAKQRENWLIWLVEKANEAISENLHSGGSTLSLIAAFGQELQIAHVGDSRIYIIRKNILCQLSEDHSMVAMLLNSSQISYEESVKHPDRNILIKSLGSKPCLSDGYVQTLSCFNSEVFLPLEDGDIILLCSDGIWDLISFEEFVESFRDTTNLQKEVQSIIHKILERGANDNATLIALKCSLESAYL